MYMESLIVPPSPLGKEESCFHWTFTLSREHCEKFPQTLDPGQGSRVTKNLHSGTEMYLFRCIKMPATGAPISESTWNLAETIWPSVIYVRVNDVDMEVRRKVYNGKDLPLDITPNLKEGNNEVSLYFLRGREERIEQLYAAGVEKLKVVDLECAKGMAATLPSSECRKRIQGRLHYRDDDDLAIVSEDITVNLCDPFMSQIFNKPARSRHCLHDECFDLDTFISTKRVTMKNALKERWKCPICGGDARPNTLIIDSFLAGVRAQLERTGQLGSVRAIEVNGDGVWKRKKIDDDGRIRRSRPATTNGHTPVSKRRASIGELDNGRGARRVKMEDGQWELASRESTEVVILD